MTIDSYMTIESIIYYLLNIMQKHTHYDIIYGDISKATYSPDILPLYYTKRRFEFINPIFIFKFGLILMLYI